MIEQIVKAAVERGASDIHIKAGAPFFARIHGKLTPLTKQVLTPEQTKAIAVLLINVEEDKAKIDKIMDYDCSWAVAGVGRFRVNIMKQRNSYMIVMRSIPLDVPTFDGLGLPQVMAKVAQSERGMILVTGVTGSGKSSTMAALINYMNQHENKHILTLENPIEFLHKDINCTITQREIGSDTADFKMGLRAALRQDPDVIMIGELRDAETIDTAMKAAETGHLLISTLHTADAQSTILRMMAMFPPEEQEVVRIRLGESLAAVISQRLLRKKPPLKGRAVAAEVMLNTATIKDMIIDGKHIGEIKDYIEQGKEQYGMQTFDQCLFDLVKDGQVTFDTAKLASSNPSDFELKMKMFAQDAIPKDDGAPPPPEPATPTPATGNEAPAIEGMQVGSGMG